MSLQKVLRPAGRRPLADWMMDRYHVSARRACELAGFSRPAWYPVSTKPYHAALRSRIREIASVRPHFGSRRVHVLLRREGWPINYKRVHRFYRLDGLQLRMRVRRRKHMGALHRGPVPKAVQRLERWSFDFVHDQPFGWRRIRILTLVDQWSRESTLLEPRFGFSGQDVADVLERWVAEHDTPVTITVDHGTEFTSKALKAWTWEQWVKRDFIHPGKPTENGHIESFNGRFRDERLNVQQFLSLNDARGKIEA